MAGGGRLQPSLLESRASATTGASQLSHSLLALRATISTALESGVGAHHAANSTPRSSESARSEPAHIGPDGSTAGMAAPISAGSPSAPNTSIAGAEPAGASGRTSSHWSGGCDAQ